VLQTQSKRCHWFANRHASIMLTTAAMSFISHLEKRWLR